MSHRHQWDRRYAGAERLFSAEADDVLVELAGGLPPGRALDLGAGEGRNSLWLAARGWAVVAVDFSQVALVRLARERVPRGASVLPVAADISEPLVREGTFDLVVVANVHPAPDERARVLTGAARAVAPRGHLFLVGHHVTSLGLAGPPDPEMLYTEETLTDGFPGLRVLRLERGARSRSDIGTPVVDLVVWAVRPAPAGAA